MADGEGRVPTAFSFHGNWQDFSKIVIPNVLLTLVTLGIYRFWATTRERQYLWSHTEFIDERLEWTGRGIELFIGFVMVFFLIGLPLIFLQFGAQALVLRGYPILAVVLSVVAFVAIFYLSGVAYFRAMRYRLSRSYWRGIRGGSNSDGLTYGLSYLWKNVAAMIPLFLLYPWASMSLWNERWSHMSFGPYQFESNAQWTKLMKRYMLFYLAPFLIIVGAAIIGFQAAQNPGSDPFGGGGVAAFGVFFVLLIFASYILLPIAALLYFSKFYRVAVGGLKLGELEFDFKARSPDWILFFLANMVFYMLAYAIAIIPFMLLVAVNLQDFMANMAMGETQITVSLVVAAILALVPFGFVAAIIRYRSWKFFVTHMEAYGEVNLDQLTQSQTETDRHGEGLLDAFDVGAL
jgi:uncharacterized membrane protein YjgN (DUF898 family)